MKKNYTEVTIAGKIYTLGGYEDAEYLQRIATYLNTKNAELRQTQGFLRQSADYQNIMLQLNLADDYFKAKKKAGMLESKIELMEKEIYHLKHELVSTQMRIEKKTHEPDET